MLMNSSTSLQGLVVLTLSSTQRNGTVGGVGGKPSAVLTSTTSKGASAGKCSSMYSGRGRHCCPMRKQRPQGKCRSHFICGGSRVGRCKGGRDGVEKEGKGRVSTHDVPPSRGINSSGTKGIYTKTKYRSPCWDFTHTD
jgi:hypothetical protein